MVEIWSARVYRSRDIYVGAPAQLLNKTLSVGDWAVEVTIGSVPVSITRAVAVQHAVMPYILGKINTRADPAKPTEAELKAKADAYQPEKAWPLARGPPAKANNQIAYIDLGKYGESNASRLLSAYLTFWDDDRRFLADLRGSRRR